MVELQAERAAAEAAQQACAELHHQQAMLRSLWEGLGAAVALRRAAHQKALQHLHHIKQRQVPPCTPDMHLASEHFLLNMSFVEPVSIQQAAA